MGPVVHQPRNVVLGHLGQLFLKYAFQSSQDDCALSLIVIIHDAEFDFAIALLEDGGLEDA